MHTKNIKAQVLYHPFNEPRDWPAAIGRVQVDNARSSRRAPLWDKHTAHYGDETSPSQVRYVPGTLDAGVESDDPLSLNASGAVLRRWW